MSEWGREIIIVDDDTGMSQAIERLLAAAGLKAHSFTCVEELLSSGDCIRAGILILDIQLPGMSGLELIRHPSMAGLLPPVIFITGQDRPNIKEQALLAGAADYFIKPFAGSDLLHSIRLHLLAL